MANRIQIRHGNTVPVAETQNQSGLLAYEMGWYNDTLYINDGITTAGHDPIRKIGGQGFIDEYINNAIGDSY